MGDTDENDSGDDLDIDGDGGGHDDVEAAVADTHVADAAAPGPDGGGDDGGAGMTEAPSHPLVSEELAEELDKSRNLLHAYADCKQLLKDVGDMPSVVAIENNER